MKTSRRILSAVALGFLLTSFSAMTPAYSAEVKTGEQGESDDISCNGELEGDSANIKISDRRSAHNSPALSDVVDYLAGLEAAGKQPPFDFIQNCINEHYVPAPSRFVPLECVRPTKDNEDESDDSDGIDINDVLAALAKETINPAGITILPSVPLVNEAQTYQLANATQNLTLNIKNHTIDVTLNATITNWHFPNGKTTTTTGNQTARTTYQNPTKYEGVKTTTYWNGYFIHPTTKQQIPLTGTGTTYSQTPQFRIWAYPITLTDPNQNP